MNSSTLNDAARCMTLSILNFVKILSKDFKSAKSDLKK